MTQSTLLQNIFILLLSFGLFAGIYGFLTMMVGYCKIQRAIIAFKILFVFVLSSFGGGMLSSLIKEHNFSIGMGIFVLAIMLILLFNVLLATCMLKVLQQIEDNFPEEKRIWHEKSRRMLEDFRRQNPLPQ